jgi:hypothetical protein
MSLTLQPATVTRAHPVLAVVFAGQLPAGSSGVGFYIDEHLRCRARGRGQVACKLSLQDLPTGTYTVIARALPNGELLDTAALTIEEDAAPSVRQVPSNGDLLVVVEAPATCGEVYKVTVSGFQTGGQGGNVILQENGEVVRTATISATDNPQVFQLVSGGQAGTHQLLASYTIGNGTAVAGAGSATFTVPFSEACNNLVLTPAIIDCNTGFSATLHGLTDGLFVQFSLNGTEVLGTFPVPAGATSLTVNFPFHLPAGNYTLTGLAFTNTGSGFLTSDALLIVNEGTACPPVTEFTAAVANSPVECNKIAYLVLSGFATGSTIDVSYALPGQPFTHASEVIEAGQTVLIVTLASQSAGTAPITVQYTPPSGTEQTFNLAATFAGSTCIPPTLQASPKVVACGENVKVTFTRGQIQFNELYLGTGADGPLLCSSVVPASTAENFTCTFSPLLAAGRYGLFFRTYSPITDNGGGEADGGASAFTVTGGCPGVVTAVLNPQRVGPACDLQIVTTGIVDPTAGGTLRTFLDGVLVGTTVFTIPSARDTVHFVTAEFPNFGAHKVSSTYASADGKLTLTAAARSFEITAPLQACSGGDPHIMCLDGSRLDVYDPGFYRMFDNLRTGAQVPVVINAEIIRNPHNQEDMYRKVWIKVGTQTEELIFREQQVRSRSTNWGPDWKKSYTDPEGLTYQLTVEAAHHTVALEMSERKPGAEYCGLFAGQIARVASIQDTRAFLPPAQYPRFNHSALLCGSSQPHVITTDRKVIRPRHGTYRLLQFPGGCVNVTVDADGLLRKVRLHQEGTTGSTWEWLGAYHWQTTCQEDWQVVSRDAICTRQLPGGILLRVQPNGSVSVALDDLSGVTGLVTGDVIPVALADALPFAFVQPQPLPLARGPTLYERFIAPVVV